MRHKHEREAHASGRRIAVIGAGIAGLSAAWLLSRTHQVALYEKVGWLGGHANTVDVDCPEGGIAVDTGFIVFNPNNYPNFTALLDHLGVGTVHADMSFAASIDDGRLEYSSQNFFGQKRNYLRPAFWSMLLDIARFYGQTRKLNHGALDGVSLGDFLERENYSTAMVDQHLLPMCAAIWSTTPTDARNFPMQSFLRFFSSHGLLDVQVKNRPQWRTVGGGSRSYVDAMLADMSGKFTVHTGARRVVRHGGLVIVEDAEGQGEVFTDVVIAAHADEALALLAEPTEEERKVLGAFRYTPNTAILHDDAGLMPKRRSVWGAWNYIGTDQPDTEQQLCVSYWMNHLQQLNTKRQLFVTLNPTRAPKPGSEIASFNYTHPLFDAAALRAQNQLFQLQGIGNTWYCGSYFGYGFHEDALQSGLAVAEALGERRPWGPRPNRIATAPELLAAE